MRKISRNCLFIWLIFSVLLSSCGVIKPKLPDDSWAVGGSVSGMAIPQSQIVTDDDQVVHDPSLYPDREIIIVDNLIVLNEESGKLLESHREDDKGDNTDSEIGRIGGQLIFWETNEQLSSVYIGAYVAMLPNWELPDGTLRKIIGIETNSQNKLVFHTERAYITDIIEQGTIKLDVALDYDDIRETSWYIGSGKMSRPNNPKGSGFGFSFDKIFKDQNGQVRLIGDGTIKPDFKLVIDIEKFKLSNFVVSNQTTQTATIQVDATGNVEFNPKVQLLIAQIKFNPIIKYISGLPVVFTPILSVYIGVDGKIATDMTLSVKQNTTSQRGIAFQNGQWFTFNDLMHADFDFTIPTVSGPLQMRVFAAPQLAIKLYGIVGPYIEADSYISAQAAPNNFSDWELHAGFDLIIGIEVGQWGFVVVEIDEILYHYDKLLWSSASGNPPQGQQQTTPVPVLQSPASWCADRSGVLMSVGMTGTINYKAVNLRDAPYVPPNDPHGNLVDGMYMGDKIKIVGGPQCAYNGTWWQVETHKGSVGWAREYLPNMRLISP